MRRRWLFTTPFLLWLTVASAQIAGRLAEEEEAKPWQEEEVTLPTAAPAEEDWLPLYVGELTPHRFFVAATSIAVGGDGVIRYVLLVQSAGGARNVGFEGIRCATREWRLYATLQADGSWRKAKLSRWRPIENKPVNRQHAALWREHFCPEGIPVARPEAARESLLRDARLLRGP